MVAKQTLSLKVEKQYALADGLKRVVAETVGQAYSAVTAVGNIDQQRG